MIKLIFFSRQVSLVFSSFCIFPQRSKVSFYKSVRFSLLKRPFQSLFLSALCMREALSIQVRRSFFHRRFPQRRVRGKQEAFARFGLSQQQIWFVCTSFFSVKNQFSNPAPKAVILVKKSILKCSRRILKGCTFKVHFYASSFSPGSSAITQSFAALTL